MILETTISLAFILWIVFISISPIIIKFYDKYNGEIGLAPYTYKVILGTFILYDIVVNYGPGSVIFLQRPKTLHHRNDILSMTFTHRLKYNLIEEPYTWRGRLASWICKYLVEPWHPGHCGLR